MNISLDGNAPSFEETANQNSKMEKDCDSLRFGFVVYDSESSVEWSSEITHPIYGGHMSLCTQLTNKFNLVETF